jgi:plasmid maintenance system antidote protein VapI
MSMQNPPHPGEFIREGSLEPFQLSYRKVAAKGKREGGAISISETH